MVGEQPSIKFCSYFVYYCYQTLVRPTPVIPKVIILLSESISPRRLPTLNLRYTRNRWNFTVPSEIPSCRAMSLLHAPTAASLAISCSRGVRPLMWLEILAFRRARGVKTWCTHETSADVDGSLKTM